jgi:hypothetical protein
MDLRIGQVEPRLIEFSLSAGEITHRLVAQATKNVEVLISRDKDRLIARLLRYLLGQRARCMLLFLCRSCTGFGEISVTRGV